MDSRIRSWLDSVLDSGGSARIESSTDVNLTLTMSQFEAKMLQDSQGLQFLRLLQCGEGKVCERMGLLSPYKKGGVIYFNVLRWWSLLAHLRAVLLLRDL